ncbi:hypothetical protein D3C87_2178020 [compost metagenome]
MSEYSAFTSVLAVPVLRTYFARKVFLIDSTSSVSLLSPVSLGAPDSTLLAFRSVTPKSAEESLLILVAV